NNYFYQSNIYDIMYTSIYQNSYIVALIVFIILVVIFYLFEIGYVTEIDPDGKIVKKFSWRYPLAIALIVWLIWHFWLFPPKEDSHDETYSPSASPNSYLNKMYKPKYQDIIM